MTAATTDPWLDRIDARFGRVDAQFDQVDERFDRLEAKFDEFERTMFRCGIALFCSIAVGPLATLILVAIKA